MQISKSQLNRKLQEIGFSPAKLILHYRMELAKQMLDSGVDSIEEIAEQSGFSGLTGFSRKFKQEFSSNPSGYRKKILRGALEVCSWKMPLNENNFNQLSALIIKNKWLAKLFIIVLENLDNDLFSIEELSQKLFMSSSNLNRKIQRLFGFSTLRLVRELRLQQASELLNIQNKSVNEAAVLSGFFDAAHLSRYFKPVFDCSPNDYRDINVCFSFIDKLKKESMNQIDK